MLYLNNNRNLTARLKRYMKMASSSLLSTICFVSATYTEQLYMNVLYSSRKHCMSWPPPICEGCFPVMRSFYVRVLNTRQWKSLRVLSIPYVYVGRKNAALEINPNAPISDPTPTPVPYVHTNAAKSNT